MAAIVSGSASSGAWPCLATTSARLPDQRRVMASSVSAESRSELAPRIVSTGAGRSASNCAQLSGSGFDKSSASSVRASAGS